MKMDIERVWNNLSEIYISSYKGFYDEAEGNEDKFHLEIFELQRVSSYRASTISSYPSRRILITVPY